MIKERFMVTGKRITDGSTVSGYYGEVNSVSAAGKPYKQIKYTQIHCNGFWNIVDTNTVEPVAVKVVKEKLDEFESSINCPNCDTALINNDKEFGQASSFDWIGYIEKDFKYCPNCGQRLDWSK